MISWKNLVKNGKFWKYDNSYLRDIILKSLCLGTPFNNVWNINRSFSCSHEIDLVRSILIVRPILKQLLTIDTKHFSDQY